MPNYARITGWGMYVPPRVMTNQELEQLIDTSDAWIRRRTGIRERRIAGDNETASSMAVAAGQKALEVAHLDPASLDLIIAATVTPDQIFPACASLVQHAIGAKKASAFDLNAACSGFVYALAVATQFISAGTFRRVLVVGSEVYSRILDWKDRSTCVLFGDGAGAVVVEACDSPPATLGLLLGSDGSKAGILYVPGPCGPRHPTPNGRYYLNMDGQEVFRFAVTTLVEATRQVVAAAGLPLSDIELIIPHQANRRIFQAAARSLGLPQSRIFANVERYGNTSAASIPIAICEAVDEGKLNQGDHVVLVGFGGGLSWGALVMEWAGASPAGKG